MLRNVDRTTKDDKWFYQCIIKGNFADFLQNSDLN